jgi:hypothetical protein
MFEDLESILYKWLKKQMQLFKIICLAVDILENFVFLLLL